MRIARPNGRLSEFRKRVHALKHREEGVFYPYWTIQAYVDQPGGRVLAVGVAKTVELYRSVIRRARRKRPYPQRSSSSGEQLKYFPPSAPSRCRHIEALSSEHIRYIGQRVLLRESHRLMCFTQMVEGGKAGNGSRMASRPCTLT